MLQIVLGFTCLTFGVVGVLTGRAAAADWACYVGVFGGLACCLLGCLFFSHPSPSPGEAAGRRNGLPADASQDDRKSLAKTTYVRALSRRPAKPIAAVVTRRDPTRTPAPASRARVGLRGWGLNQGPVNLPV